MNRFWHRLSIWLATLSLTLGILFFALASPGKKQTDTFFHRTGTGTYYVLEFVPGWVYVKRSSYIEPMVSHEPLNFRFWGHDRSPAFDGEIFSPEDLSHSTWNHLGFGECDGIGDLEKNWEEYQYHNWIFPVWFPVGILAILPAIVMASMLHRKIRMMRQRVRRSKGACPICGY
ncbi:MAG: hypothetical protein ABSC42_13295, partial [Tepidisphaeraceae bacterium]